MNKRDQKMVDSGKRVKSVRETFWHILFGTNSCFGLSRFVSLASSHSASYASTVVRLLIFQFVILGCLLYNFRFTRLLFKTFSVASAFILSFFTIILAFRCDDLLSSR